MISHLKTPACNMLQCPIFCNASQSCVWKSKSRQYNRCDLNMVNYQEILVFQYFTICLVLKICTNPYKDNFSYMAVYSKSWYVIERLLVRHILRPLSRRVPHCYVKNTLCPSAACRISNKTSYKRWSALSKSKQYTELCLINFVASLLS